MKPVRSRVSAVVGAAVLSCVVAFTVVRATASGSGTSPVVRAAASGSGTAPVVRAVASGSGASPVVLATATGSGSGTSRNANSRSSKLAQCLTRGSLLLGPRDIIGTFVTIHDQLVTAPPFKGGIRGGKGPIFQREYMLGRVNDMITTLALHGKYRANENAEAKALNYPIMKWPYVPLWGLIVRDNPHKVLEVGEQDYVFQTPAAAAAWVASGEFSGTQETPDGRRLDSLPKLGDQTVGYEYGSPDDLVHEHFIVVLIRTGGLGIAIFVQGGVAEPEGAAIRLARIAESRVTKMCPTVLSSKGA